VIVEWAVDECHRLEDQRRAVVMECVVEPEPHGRDVPTLDLGVEVFALPCAGADA